MRGTAVPEQKLDTHSFRLGQVLRLDTCGALTVMRWSVFALSRRLPLPRPDERLPGRLVALGAQVVRHRLVLTSSFGQDARTYQREQRPIA